MNCRKTNRKTGFTLVELLVVIAIIAILAAMLIPALTRSKAQALSIVCKNHLHEMALALAMYVEDNNAYPFYFPPRWNAELQPTYKLDWSNPGFHCPAYNGAISGTDNDAQFGSYSYNTFGVDPIGFEDNSRLGLGLLAQVAPQRATRVVSPSEMFVLMDTQARWPNSDLAWLSVTLGPGWTGVDSTGCFWQGLFSPGSTPLQHGKLFNVVFCDAHVTAVPVLDLFNPAKTAKNWNIDHLQASRPLVSQRVCPSGEFGW